MVDSEISPSALRRGYTNAPYAHEDVAICRCWWAIKDSNLGPTGYEPVALTN